MQLQHIILLCQLKFLQIFQDMIELDIDIFQKNLFLQLMKCIFKIDENDFEKKLNQELFYEVMFYLLDIMMLISKKQQK